MMIFCDKIKSTLFELLNCFKIAMITNVFIHDGKDPSVEIKCFNNKATIKIMFSGDLERQQFIEKVNKVRTSNNEMSSSEEEDETTRGQDSDEDEEDDGEVSDEERVPPVMYG